MNDPDLCVERLSAAIAAGDPDATALDRLGAATATAAELRELSEALLDDHVRVARAEGRSWAEIGSALAVSRQAAQQRFAEAVEAPTWPEDFSEGARAAVARAQGEAVALRHRFLGTEHVLLALTTDDGLAGVALARLGVREDAVRAGILEQVGPGYAGGPDLGVAPRLKRVLEATRQEARRAGLRCAGPEHLMLALSGREDTVAARIMRGLGADDDRVRATLADLVSGESPDWAAELRRRPGRGRRRGRHRRSD